MTHLSTEELRALCIKNNWFTCGNNEQYDKLFTANKDGASLNSLSDLIWLCSDDSFSRYFIFLKVVEAVEAINSIN